VPLPLDLYFQYLTNIATFFWRTYGKPLPLFLEKVSTPLAALKNTVISHPGQLASYIPHSHFVRRDVYPTQIIFTGTLFAAKPGDDIFLAMRQ
jgi:hypothetical protein